MYLYIISIQKNLFTVTLNIRAVIKNSHSLYRKHHEAIWNTRTWLQPIRFYMKYNPFLYNPYIQLPVI